MKNYLRNFPGSTVVKNPPANAGGHGFDPWSGKISRAVEQLSSMHHNYWGCALEPASHNYWAHMPQLLKPARHKRSHHNEKPVQRTKTQCSQKKKLINNFLKIIYCHLQLDIIY